MLRMMLMLVMIRMTGGAQVMHGTLSCASQLWMQFCSRYCAKSTHDVAAFAASLTFPIDFATYAAPNVLYPFHAWATTHNRLTCDHISIYLCIYVYTSGNNIRAYRSRSWCERFSRDHMSKYDVYIYIYIYVYLYINVPAPVVHSERYHLEDVAGDSGTFLSQAVGSDLAPFVEVRMAWCPSISSSFLMSSMHADLWWHFPSSRDIYLWGDGHYIYIYRSVDCHG